MPKLRVRPISEEDIYKDIVQVPEVHRVGEDGSSIEESTVCWIDGTPHASVAVLRGYQQSSDAEIHMDERTRNRLGVKVGESHEFKFKRAGWWGQLRWAWNASETGYRVTSRLAVIGLLLGLLAFVPVLVEFIKWLWAKGVTRSLDTSLDIYQFVRHIGEIILVLGLLGDLFALIFLRGRDRSEKRLGVAATVVVILGVIIESWAGARGDDVVRQMRAPRSLSESKQKMIAATLKPFGTHECVFYEVSDVDPEIAGITVDLSKACAFANWKSGFETYPPNPPMWLRAPGRGILILVSPGATDKTVLPAAEAFKVMLKSEGLDVELSQAFVGPYPPADDRLRIVVYVK
jgi:hypothetical protein